MLNYIKLNKKLILFSLFLLFFMSKNVFSKIEDRNINYLIDVQINPDESTITGAAKITINNNTEKEIPFQLLKSIKIKEFKSTDFDYRIDESDSLYNQIIVQRKANASKESSKFMINYEGKVNNPPKQINLTQRHSNSLGIISAKNDEGIYLPAGAFYPSADNTLGLFECVVKAPKDYTMITSGNLLENSVAGNFSVTKWKMPFATDELTLVGGKFVQYKKEFDGKTFNLFTYDSTKSSDTYLDATIKYYKIYTGLFGDYPFNMFSIVDNFFATGFGMPAYTLLSGKLLAMPWVTLSPGSLAHEFVHNWWGNSVYVDYNGGNWCEALTTFSANYYYNIATENFDGAVDWRKKSLMALESLEPEKNYPVIDFKYQNDMYDAVIGYDKGGFIFYEIMKLIGKDNFFAALKSFSHDFRGKRAYWSDLIDEFTKVAPYSISQKYNLKDEINKWLNSKEIPSISIGNVSKNGDELKVEIKKSDDFLLTIPVVVFGDGKTDKEYFTIKDKSTEVTIKTNFQPEKVVIDPDYEALRKLYKWEIPYSFNQTLAENTLIILPPVKSPNYQIAEEFYKEMKESGYKCEAKILDEVSSEDINNNSLILLGSPDENQLLKQIINNFPNDLKLVNNEFLFKDKKSKEDESILLINTDHPSNPKKFCTAIYFNNLPDFNPIKRLFHYQSYSLVLLSTVKTGRPLFSTELFPKSSSHSELEKILK